MKTVERKTVEVTGWRKRLKERRSGEYVERRLGDMWKGSILTIREVVSITVRRSFHSCFLISPVRPKKPNGRAQRAIV